MTSADTIGAYLEQATCDDVSPGVGRIRSLLRSPATWADPPPDLRDRVLAAIRTEHQRNVGDIVGI